MSGISEWIIWREWTLATGSKGLHLQEKAQEKFAEAARVSCCGDVTPYPLYHCPMIPFIIRRQLRHVSTQPFIIFVWVDSGCGNMTSSVQERACQRRDFRQPTLAIMGFFFSFSLPNLKTTSSIIIADLNILHFILEGFLDLLRLVPTRSPLSIWQD